MTYPLWHLGLALFLQGKIRPQRMRCIAHSPFSGFATHSRNVTQSAYFAGRGHCGLRTYGDQTGSCNEFDRFSPNALQSPTRERKPEGHPATLPGALRE
jgi:hypothetical protein